jgi:hypothetical protein
LVLSNQPKEPVRRVETAAGLAGIVVSWDFDVAPWPVKRQ